MIFKLIVKNPHFYLTELDFECSKYLTNRLLARIAVEHIHLTSGRLHQRAQFDHAVSTGDVNFDPKFQNLGLAVSTFLQHVFLDFGSHGFIFLEHAGHRISLF